MGSLLEILKKKFACQLILTVPNEWLCVVFLLEIMYAGSLFTLILNFILVWLPMIFSFLSGFICLALKQWLLEK